MKSVIEIVKQNNVGRVWSQSHSQKAQREERSAAHVRRLDALDALVIHEDYVAVELAVWNPFLVKPHAPYVRDHAPESIDDAVELLWILRLDVAESRRKHQS